LTRRFKNGALTGLFLWLQIISCVYYGAFSRDRVVLALLLMASRPEQAAAPSARCVWAR